MVILSRRKQPWNQELSELWASIILLPLLVKQKGFLKKIGHSWRYQYSIKKYWLLFQIGCNLKQDKSGSHKESKVSLIIPNLYRDKWMNVTLWIFTWYPSSLYCYSCYITSKIKSYWNLENLCYLKAKEVSQNIHLRFISLLLLFCAKFPFSFTKYHT